MAAAVAQQRIAAQRGLPQSAPSQRAPVASGEQYVGKLSEEFNRKRTLFDDDLAFIREVKSSETPAVGMDPDTELATLHKRFSNWKKEFKVHCCCTHVCETVLIDEHVPLASKAARASLLISQEGGIFCQQLS